MMIRIIPALLLMIGATAQAAHTIKFISDCPNTVYIAQGHVHDAGTDDIGASGSISQLVSQGWWEIDAYKDLELPYQQYAAVYAGGEFVSRVDATKDYDAQVKKFCTKDKEFKYAIYTIDNHSGHPIDVEGDCKSAGGFLEWFEQMAYKDGTLYTEYKIANCGPKKN